MDQSRVQELVTQFSQKKLLIVGDVVVDRYIHGRVERLNPEAPVPILHAHHLEEQTGGAGNTAKNVAGLEAEAVLVSVVGDDAAAAELQALAQQEGYRPQVISDASRKTIRKERYLVNGQQLLRVDYEETHAISTDIEEALLASLRERVAEVDGIIVSDYAKGVVTEAIAHTLVELAREHDLLLAADVKPALASAFRGATFISPNRKEAHEYLGLNQFDHGGKPATELATALFEKMQSTVFLTLSEEGMYVCGENEPGTYVPQTNVVDVADTSGAGDTAAAVLALALLSGATPVEAAELANAAGAVIVSKIGAVGLTQAELLEMMNRAEATR